MFNNFHVSAGLNGRVQLSVLADFHVHQTNSDLRQDHNSTRPHLQQQVPPHLFEFESKETVTLRADWHAGEIRQRNAGLHLARLGVSQDDVLLGQQEDSSCALRKKESRDRSGPTCQHANIVPKKWMRRPKCVFKCIFFLWHLWNMDRVRRKNIIHLSRHVCCLLEQK